MSYAAWRNASMKFQVFAKRIKDKDELDALCYAAWKAGERQGRKEAGEADMRAIQSHLFNRCA